MKSILFARTSSMKFYRGITENDIPANGGDFVKQTGYAHESNNFRIIESEGRSICLGFTMLAGRNTGELHIERIEGCSCYENAEYVDGVNVIFCAKPINGKSVRVVGFYKNARVYRYPQYMEIERYDGTEYTQEYNFVADEKDCVLLPLTERNEAEWYVPQCGKNGSTFGMGRASICYFTHGREDRKIRDFLENMNRAVESYKGDNWMYVEEDELNVC